MNELIQTEQNKSNEYKIKPMAGTKNLVALTQDNVAKIEAMIATDSAYARGFNKNEEPQTKTIRKKKDALEIKYVGSVAFWMTLLKVALENGGRPDSHDAYKIRIKDENEEKDSESFTLDEILAGAIAAVDNENATHLNSNGIGKLWVWEQIREFIRKNKAQGVLDCLRNRRENLFNCIGGLVKAINDIGERKQHNEKCKTAFVKHPWLFGAIAASEKRTKYNDRKNISFASKFCHYASFYVFKDEDGDAQDGWSIWDNVLKKVLPKYLDFYKIAQWSPKDLEDYWKYCKAVDETIIKSGNEISRNGFDHLLWYYYKGKVNDLDGAVEETSEISD